MTDEDSTTELLCNLMRFAAFREAVLPTLLGSTLAREVAFDQIETQVDLARRGRADLLVRTESLCAILAVKVTPWTGLTKQQERAYVAYLSEQPQAHRVFAFLVPNGWRHVSALEQVRAEAGSSAPSINTRITYWTDVLAVIETMDLQKLSPLFAEMLALLAPRFRPAPLTFSAAEVSMLFDKALPDTVAKLDQLLTQVQEKAGAYKLQLSSRPRRLWIEEEYGFYFRNKVGQDVLWFGVWLPFWRETGYPLCFGVDQTWPSPVRKAFTSAYAGQTHQFQGWTLGVVPQQTLAPDAPADTIWRKLGPIADTVTRAGGDNR